MREARVASLALAGAKTRGRLWNSRERGGEESANVLVWGCSMNDEAPAAPPLNNPTLGPTRVLPIYSSLSSAHGYIPPAAHPSGFLVLRVGFLPLCRRVALCNHLGNIWSQWPKPHKSEFVWEVIGNALVLKYDLIINIFEENIANLPIQDLPKHFLECHYF